MNFIELDEKLPIDLTTAPDRSFDKLHLSTIYTDLEKKLGLDKTRTTTENPLWAQTGFLWERALAEAFRDAYPYIVRPGEITKDGIVMSPDGINLKYDMLEEYKCTWSSSNKKPWDIWKWMTQTKGYCYGLGVLSCYFRVWYVNGSYGKGSAYGPEYKAYIINFTQSELDENWEMVLKHAKSIGLLL